MGHISYKIENILKGFRFANQFSFQSKFEDTQFETWLFENKYHIKPCFNSTLEFDLIHKRQSSMKERKKNLLISSRFF